MQVWRNTQAGLRMREHKDVVNMYLGGNSFDKYRVRAI